MLLSGFCHCPDDAARECSKGFFSKRSVHGHACRAPAIDMELLANGLSKKKEAKYGMCFCQHSSKHRRQPGSTR